MLFTLDGLGLLSLEGGLGFGSGKGWGTLKGCSTAYWGRELLLEEGERQGEDGVRETRRLLGEGGGRRRGIQLVVLDKEAGGTSFASMCVRERVVEHAAPYSPTGPQT